MEQLFKLKRVKAIYNLHNLRRLYDDTSFSFRNLGSLGISNYGEFSVPLLTDDLLTSLQSSVSWKITSEIWDLTYMMHYFKIE